MLHRLQAAGFIIFVTASTFLRSVLGCEIS